jgi:hypothetical protein
MGVIGANLLLAALALLVALPATAKEFSHFAGSVRRCDNCG